jgi:membrane fusion protein
MSSDLFRKEVLNSKKNKWVGSIILSRPFSFTFLTICAVIIGLIIIAFSVWGSYTKRSTVPGQLIPKTGLIQVYATQQGTIVQKNAYEGQVVKKGDTLFLISTANYGENGDIAAALSKQTQLKEQSIRNEIMRLHIVHKSERESLVNQSNLLKEYIRKMDSLINNQKNAVDLAKINENRYQAAFKQNAVSNEELEEKKTNYFSEFAQYESLKREKITFEKQLNEQIINLSGLENKQRNEIEQLERLLSTNNQELIEMQFRQKVAITSHTTGAVSTINGEIGQFVDLSKPLITILPENTPLVAQLYVPSRAIGFVKEGDEVLLRYQSYPYQKFGHAKAKVLSVAKTAVAGQDLKTIGTISPQQQINNEPVYLVRAQLEKQIVKAYGKDMPLKVGMTFEADIMHETRNLYEWVLEPLFSITGKL